MEESKKEEGLEHLAKYYTFDKLLRVIKILI
jgi:hypothetical protein